MDKQLIIQHALSFQLYGPTQSELSLLYDLCVNKDVIELGSCLGISSYVIASICNSLFCVDMWDDSFEILGSDDYQRSTYYKLKPKLFEQFCNNCSEFIQSEKIKFFRGSTDKVSSRFENNQFDILFVDADHSYNGVSSDYNNYKRVVKNGGYIAFHDYGPWPGVTKLCKEIKLNKEFEFVKQETSICLFRKK